MHNDRRASLRFDTVVLVELESAQNGRTYGVARNISSSGVFIETHTLHPLGARLRIRFLGVDGRAEMSASGKVRGHYFLDHGGPERPVVGMGVKFEKFEVDNASDEMVAWH